MPSAKLKVFGGRLSDGKKVLAAPPTPLDALAPTTRAGDLSGATSSPFERTLARPTSEDNDPTADGIFGASLPVPPEDALLDSPSLLVLDDRLEEV
jgi:hypothetical protein